MGSIVASPERAVIEAVFWDIDGTLIDSEELHYEVIADWCRLRGYTLNKQDNELLLGKSMAEKWQHLAKVHEFNSNLESFCQECADIYCEALQEGMARSESIAVFNKIAELGIPQACVSNGDMQVVEANLALLGLREMVRFSISGQDVVNGKPDPEPYLVAAEKLGVSPARCLVVEDSIVGVSAAVKAGMTAVAWPEAGTSRTGYEAAQYFLCSRDEFPWKLLNYELKS